jgi:tRNA nucleotidyltransferase/poly(A) polymerase
MFFDPLTELVHDYVGGRADLEQRQLRAIGVAADRFREDKLRLLRAIRFNSILGFNIEPATWQAVMELAPEITAVSHERIAAEFRRMLAHPSRHHSVQSLDESGLTQAIFESAVPASSTATLSALEAMQTDSFETGMAVWLKDLPKPKLDQLCSHLKLSNQERDAILWLADQQTVWIEFGDWPIARQKRLLAHPLVHELVAMGEALTAAGSIAAEHLAVARGRLKVWSPAEINPPPIVTGEDLIHWGLRPSPQFRDILESLRDQQLEGQLSSMEDARHWLVRAGHLTQS